MNNSLSRNDFSFGFGDFFIGANGENAKKITIAFIVVSLIIAVGVFLKLTK